MPDSKHFKHFQLKDGREYIVHTAVPSFLAAVVPRGSTIDIVPCFWFTESTDELKMAKLLKRMVQWYYHAAKPAADDAKDRTRAEWREHKANQRE